MIGNNLLNLILFTCQQNYVLFIIKQQMIKNMEMFLRTIVIDWNMIEVEYNNKGSNNK